jgi:hypothetical protein
LRWAGLLRRENEEIMKRLIVKPEGKRKKGRDQK